MSRFLLTAVALLASLFSLAQAARSKEVSSRSGYIPFNYNGEVFQTWYIYYSKPVVNPLRARPTIVLHGGPGFTHDYMNPLIDLAKNRPVILYDQIGNGQSTHLPSKPTSFWSIDLFVAELENVIKFFSLKRYDIVGHSWGGMLAGEFAARHSMVSRHFGLRRMVLTDSNPQRSLSIQSQAQLLKQFPADVQQEVVTGWKDPARYRQGLEQFFHVYGCRLSPWPADLTTSFDALFAEPSVSQQTGITLANWTVIDRLHKIKVPTLVMNGAHDFIQDFVIQPFLDKLPHVKYHKFENSSHTPFFEEREEFMSIVGRFLE
ncbi:proline iminopeptidase [Thelephora ganbajun]|uniref:Proline iminopeptidase n=1 Tax=Thelephora ganbajun TaxID=370292 RepID=A0ACB6Z6T2_THEGA|nr:proline iminopeptidase [Thelephora ganbajun]